MLYGRAVIDLDHNATTPLDPRVREAMVELLARDDLGNPSSRHRRGQAAREVVEAARRRVAQALGRVRAGEGRPRCHRHHRHRRHHRRHHRTSRR